MYKSADAIPAVNSANYFAEAASMLSLHEFMVVTDTATSTTYFVSVLTNDGVNVSDGTAVAETNSD